MCHASIEGYKTRKARQGETVYAVRDYYGAFAEKPGINLRHPSVTACLVCVPYETVCTLENIQFLNNHHANHKEWRKLLGKSLVATLIHTYNTWGQSRNGDTWRFANGVTVPSQLIASAIYIGNKTVPSKIFRGRKQFDAHLEKWPPSKVGVAVIEKAVAEATAVPVKTEVETVE